MLTRLSGERSASACLGLLAGTAWCRCLLDFFMSFTLDAIYCQCMHVLALAWPSVTVRPAALQNVMLSNVDSASASANTCCSEQAGSACLTKRIVSFQKWTGILLERTWQFTQAQQRA